MLVYQFESTNAAYGQLLVKLDDYNRLDTLVPQVQQYIDANFTQAQGKVWRFILGPGGGSKIEATFSGPDPEVLRDLARQAQEVYHADGKAIAIKDNWRQRVPAIEPVYSEVKGRRAGVSRSDLGAALARNYSGQQVGVYRENDDLIPIMSRAPADESPTASRRYSATVACGAPIMSGRSRRRPILLPASWPAICRRGSSRWSRPLRCRRATRLNGMGNRAIRQRPTRTSPARSRWALARWCW
jgi:hypothetical protein